MRRTLLATTALLLLAACGETDDVELPLATGEAGEEDIQALDSPEEVEGDEDANADPDRDANAGAIAGAVAAVPALPPISEEAVAGYIQTLASDEFAGRAPVTEGGMKTRQYLASEFERVGLQPVNGSYEQLVPLVELTVAPDDSIMTVTLPDGTERALEYGPEAVYWTKRVEEAVSFDDSEMVFVGFGVNAPEYGRNDYEGLDVAGKTVVMLVNDPGYYLEGEAFGGRAMTYYGRWTYKYEEAARQGAAAAIIVHETEPASYGWSVVEGSWTGPQLDLDRPDGGASRAMAEAWITKEVAEELFEAAGLDYEAAKDAALADDFTAMEMGELTASARLSSSISRSESANVVGVLEGATRPEEHVLYMAHWDHLGATQAGEDHIANGAVDNATGTAGLIAIADSFARAERRPDRSVLFVAVTAEESGLLGSAYYAEDPLVPLRDTVAGINMDAILPTGPSRDLTVVGYGASELEDVLAGIAAKRDKTLSADAKPEAGYFYRSDHISLAKKGVPMLYADKGEDLLDGGKEAGAAFAQAYTEERYHAPGDEYDPATWRMDGLVETLEILRDTGAALAYTDLAPNWYEGNEFRALRDEQLSGD